MKGPKIPANGAFVRPLVWRGAEVYDEEIVLLPVYEKLRNGRSAKGVAATFKEKVLVKSKRSEIVVPF